MSKSNLTKNMTETVIENPVAVFVMAVLSLVLGMIFIFSHKSNQPIPREEATAYCGYFDHYDTSWENYREIYFRDGAVYDVYPHTETNEFREKMESLDKGTKLYILVNPNNEYVAEIRTETEELLNFETSQQEIYSYDKGYVWIGVVACGGSAFLLIYGIALVCHKRKERVRHGAKPDKTQALRHADLSVRGRTLLETRVQGYHICYRRVKTTNELVVDGQVYDEMKGILEFEHKLCATVDGHDVEAGYDSDSFSYILFDGQTVESKKRWF